MRISTLSTATRAASTRSASRLLLTGLTTAALVAGSFVVLPVIARAAGVSLMEDFSGNALPDTLEESGGTADFSGGSAHFPLYDRRYVRTIANYDTTPFVAEATVTIVDYYGATGIAFFGLGAGDPSGWFWNEPREAPTAYVRITPGTFGGAFSMTTSAAENLGVTETGGAGTHRVRLTWNPVASTITAEIHQNFAGGPFVPTATVTEVVDEPFGATNTRIFFGGDGDVVFDDFQVTALEAVGPGAKNCVGMTVSTLANTYGGIAQAAEAFGFPSVQSLQAYIKTACAD